MSRPKRRDTDNGVELLEAVRRNDLARVKLLLQGLSRGECDSGKDTVRSATALFWAVDRDNPSMVTELIGAGADVNRTDSDEVTPTHHACFKGHEGALRALLVAKPDLHLKNNEGRTPMDDARNMKHKACEDMLTATLQWEADFKEQQQRMQELQSTARGKEVESLRAELEEQKKQSEGEHEEEMMVKELFGRVTVKMEDPVVKKEDADANDVPPMPKGAVVKEEPT